MDVIEHKGALGVNEQPRYPLFKLSQAIGQRKQCHEAVIENPSSFNLLLYPTHPCPLPKPSLYRSQTQQMHANHHESQPTTRKRSPLLLPLILHLPILHPFRASRPRPHALLTQPMLHVTPIRIPPLTHLPPHQVLEPRPQRPAHIMVLPCELVLPAVGHGVQPVAPVAVVEEPVCRGVGGVV